MLLTLLVLTGCANDDTPDIDSLPESGSTNDTMDEQPTPKTEEVLLLQGITPEIGHWANTQEYNRFVSSPAFTLPAGSKLHLETELDVPLHVTILYVDENGVANLSNRLYIGEYKEPFEVEEDKQIVIRVRKKTSVYSTPDNALSTEEASQIKAYVTHPTSDKSIDQVEAKFDLYYFDIKVDRDDKNVNSSLDYDSYTGKNIQTVTCVVKLPETYTEDGEPTPIIMNMHGSSGKVEVGKWYTSSWPAVAAKISEHGYAIFDVDILDPVASIHGSFDLGAPQLISAYLKAYEYIKQNFNVQEKCAVLSRSFGTYPALYASEHLKDVITCTFIGGPRVSLKGAWDLAAPEPVNRQRMAYNYGFRDQSGKYYDATAALPHDYFAQIKRSRNEITIDATFVPMYWSFGSLDLYMLEESMQLAAAIKNSGNDIIIETIEGVDHDPVSYPTHPQVLENVLKFFDEHQEK